MAKRKTKKKASPAKAAADTAAKKTRTSDNPNPLTRKSRNIDSGRILLTTALVIVLFLAYWRTASRPLRSVLGTDRFTEISALSLHIDHTETGSESRRAWTLETSAPEGETVIAGLLEILESTRYRPDMGDLWLLQSDYRVYGLDPVSAEVNLLGEDGQVRTVNFDEAETMRTGGKRFHPVDRTVLERLAAYIEEHGEQLEADYPVGHAAPVGKQA